VDARSYWKLVTVDLELFSYFFICHVHVSNALTYQLNFRCEGTFSEYLGHLQVSGSQKQKSGHRRHVMCSPQTQFNYFCICACFFVPKMTYNVSSETLRICLLTRSVLCLYHIDVSDRITRGRNAIFGHWQECKITLQHTRPCYAKSSYRSVDHQTLYGNVHQADYVPNGPTNSVVTTVFPLRLCGGKPPVAVTRERRYGPSRLRVNDDDDIDRHWRLCVSGCGQHLSMVSSVLLSRCHETAKVLTTNLCCDVNLLQVVTGQLRRVHRLKMHRPLW